MLVDMYIFVCAVAFVSTFVQKWSQLFELRLVARVRDLSADFADCTFAKADLNGILPCLLLAIHQPAPEESGLGLATLVT